MITAMVMQRHAKPPGIQQTGRGDVADDTGGGVGGPGGSVGGCADNSFADCVNRVADGFAAGLGETDDVVDHSGSPPILK